MSYPLLIIVRVKKRRTETSNDAMAEKVFSLKFSVFSGAHGRRDVSSDVVRKADGVDFGLWFRRLKFGDNEKWFLNRFGFFEALLRSVLQKAKRQLWSGGLTRANSGYLVLKKQESEDRNQNSEVNETKWIKKSGGRERLLSRVNRSWGELVGVKKIAVEVFR